jgi:hypothetical protein
MLVGVDGQKKSARIPVRGGRFFYGWAVGLRCHLLSGAACESRDLSIGSARDLPCRVTDLRIWDAPLA